MNNKDYLALKETVLKQYKDMCKGIYLTHKEINSVEPRIMIYKIVSTYVLGRISDTVHKKRKRLTIRKQILNQEKRLKLQGKPELLNF